MKTHIAKIKFRRGLEAQRTKITPDEGEPIWTLDTKRLCIGDGTTPGGVPLAKIFQTNNAQQFTSSAVYGDIAVGIPNAADGITGALNVFDGTNWIPVVGSGSITTTNPLYIVLESGNLRQIGLKFDTNSFNIGGDGTLQLNANIQTQINNAITVSQQFDALSFNIERVASTYAQGSLLPLAYSYMLVQDNYKSPLRTKAIPAYARYKGVWQSTVGGNENVGDIYTMVIPASASARGEQSIELLYDKDQFTTTQTAVTGILSRDFCAQTNMQTGLGQSSITVNGITYNDNNSTVWSVSAGAIQTAQQLHIKEDYLELIIEKVLKAKKLI